MEKLLTYNAYIFATGIIMLAVYLLRRKGDAYLRRKYADNRLQLGMLDMARDDWVIGWNFYLPNYAALVMIGAVAAVWQEGLMGLSYLIGGALAVLVHILVVGGAYTRLVPPVFWLTAPAAILFILGAVILRG